MTENSDKIDLKNRTRDKFGIITLKPNAGCELLLNGGDITDFMFDDGPEVDLYNKYNKILAGLDDDDSPLTIYHPPEMSIPEFDAEMQKHWLTPEPYASANVEEIILELCSTDKERNRVIEEMILFREYSLDPMLRCLLWLIGIMRENNVVWGVGRGSSCASYSLYLMGVHRVNSLRYKLNFREFLK